MPDFFHYADHYYSPARFSKIVARGTVITDDILLEVFRRIDPPLLEPRQAEFVTATLDRRHGRRPSRCVPSPNWLARHILAISRPDVDPSYLAAVSARIKRGKGTTDFERAVKFHRQRLEGDRKMFIREFFWRFRKILNYKPEIVNDPDFGEIKVPAGMPPQIQAAEMTLQIVSGKLGYPWISHRQVISIAMMRHNITPINGRARTKIMP
jgi:hypothetical protein